MPAEWDPHAATWMAWPHADDWPGKARAIPHVYAQIVRELVRGEPVDILVENPAARGRARRVLVDVNVDLARVRFHVVRTDRSWTRDTVPTFVRRPGEVALVDWGFNGWARYPEWHHDDAIGRRLARDLGLRRFVPCRRRGQGEPVPVILEGGSIDVNGRGLLITTESCLLSRTQARNPGLGRRRLERIFAEQLGVLKVLWLGEGIAGDDTHGHVDDLARFVSARSVVAVREDDPQDPNHAPLEANLRRLREMTDPAGRPLRIITLPMPQPLFYRGERLPASYANFYIANRSVLVPTFNDPHDRTALARLAGVFSTRRVVGIHATDLVVGRGAIHCCTQNQPDA